MERRLAAILLADVVGFSAQVSADESGTHRRLSALRDEFITPLVTAHRGRVVKTMGDGFLCEFSSVVDAVECALAWQAGPAAPSGRDGFRFRIGIALGDVIVEGDDVFGEGVNLAARLESLAEADGILVSEHAYWQVRGKVEARFDDLGPRALKNIPEPVRVFRVTTSSTAETDRESTSVLSVPDRPSIAVMPFVNRSGDPEQEYFSDGITEDLVTALSRIRWFFVIARNSSFAYKDRSYDARSVARELGVSYVVEGSVRRAGDRVRVTAELTEAGTGRQVWANRYDRDIADIFEVQDDITQTIVGAIEPEMSKVERDRAASKAPGSLVAWDLYQRGMAHLYLLTKDELDQARQLFEKAIESDPELAPAHAALAEADYYEVVYGYADSMAENRERALGHARRAVFIDPEDASGHSTLGRVLYLRGEHEDAILELETAIELNPSLALAHYGLGAALVFSGRAEEAIAPLETAVRLSPRDPNMGSFLVRLADAYFLMGDAGLAVQTAKKALQQPRFQWSRYSILIATLGSLGRADEAASWLAQLIEQRPDFSIEFVRENHLYTDPVCLERYLQALRDAGVPEGSSVG
jgi:adenylate cyclase